MPEPRPHTGPVTLPPDPKAVADGKVHDLSSLGNMHRTPTPREYEHAALDVALSGDPEEHVYAVLAHLDAAALRQFDQGLDWLRSALAWRLRDIDGPQQ